MTMMMCTAATAIKRPETAIFHTKRLLTFLVGLVLVTLHVVTYACNFQQQILPQKGQVFYAENIALEASQVATDLPSSPAPTSTNQTATKNLASAINETQSHPPEQESQCHSENAVGHFESFESREPSAGGWKWVSDDSDCPITDYLNPILDGSSELIKTPPISFLAIGDSLDYRSMDFVCQASQGRNTSFRMQLPTQSQPQSQPQRLPTAKNATATNNTRSTEPLNTAKYAWSNNGICHQENTSSASGSDISFSFFKLYGMHQDCENGGYREIEESRNTENTAQRVRKLLPVDTLSALPADTSYVVLLSSSLWDLSAGCNNQLNVTDEYQEQYRQGILALHEAVRDTVPMAGNSDGSPPVIYWRTSPKITKEYDQLSTKRQGGRTRGNQQTLNRLLRETVEKHQLGIVVDWWAMTETIPESVLTKTAIVQFDGRHYKSEVSLAFLNMWLNAVFERNPSLLLPRTEQ